MPCTDHSRSAVSLKTRVRSCSTKTGTGRPCVSWGRRRLPQSKRRAGRRNGRISSQRVSSRTPRGQTDWCLPSTGQCGSLYKIDYHEYLLSLRITDSPGISCIYDLVSSVAFLPCYFMPRLDRQLVWSIGRGPAIRLGAPQAAPPPRPYRRHLLRNQLTTRTSPSPSRRHHPPHPEAGPALST